MLYFIAFVAILWFLNHIGVLHIVVGFVLGTVVVSVVVSVVVALIVDSIKSKKAEKERIKKRAEEEELARLRAEQQRQDDEARHKEQGRFAKSHEAVAIRARLRTEGVKCLYHFTSEENWEKIREEGLYSWAELERQGKLSDRRGDYELSRRLDVRHGLQDYVRLSFCDDHPMAYRLFTQRGESYVLITIDVEAATLAGVLFSDINATDNGHHIGVGLEGLELVDIKATKRSYLRREDPDFKLHQAEVLIPKHLPPCFIERMWVN